MVLPLHTQRVFNTPLLIHPAKAEVIVAGMSGRWGVAEMVRADGQRVSMSLGDYDYDEGSTDPNAGYDVVEGVAVIEVRGTLVQRNGSLRPYSGMMGYDGLRRNLRSALASSSVRAIVLLVDSPGGEVAGCFDFADEVHAARGVKPIWAILDENAFSAAYAIASAAEHITVPRTGGTGSVGVIYMHVSMEGALEKAGVEVTLITKGDLKGDGSDVKALSPAARKRMQADIDEVGDLFDATVARNRGISARHVFDTQAGTFLGQRGVEIGFADAVMAPDEAFAALLAELG